MCSSPRYELYFGEQAQKISAMYQGGQSCEQIAAIIGCSRPTVYRVLVHLGIPRRPSGMIGRRHTDEAKKAVSDANKSRVPGDCWITTDGYISVYQPEHPHADSNGDVREHRLVMEEILGRYLLPNEVVHHTNGIKHDNAPENLSLFASASDHSSHHAPTGRKLSAETKAAQASAKQKSGLRCDNQSGVKGVCWDLRRENWRVSIGVNGKTIELGSFARLPDAVQARLDAEKKYWTKD